ncbi:MAG: hypothetical protein EXR45_00080 [Chloroflexi bacterium]|nr:hypothetical protein [Chloroflexota bacterium]
MNIDRPEPAKNTYKRSLNAQARPLAKAIWVGVALLVTFTSLGGSQLSLANGISVTPSPSPSPSMSGPTAITTKSAGTTTTSTGRDTVRLTFRVHSSVVRRAAAWVASLGVSPEASVGAPSTTSYTPGLPDLDLRAIEVPAGQADQAIATLASRLDIQWVERVATVRKHETTGTMTATPTATGGAPVRARLLSEPNDTRFAAQWGLVNSGAKSAWPVAGAINAGTPVTVAVVDTGVQLDHPDLVNRLAPTSTWGKCLSTACTPYSSSNSSTFPSDGDGHGTHVAGIIAAETDNGIGVAGVAGDRPVLIMPVQVLDADGNGTTDGVAAGIAWAVAKGAKVINLSLGGDQDTQAVKSAIDAAYIAGALVVVSAGNCGEASYAANGCNLSNEKDYPAAYADTGSNGNGKLIPVAAVDSTNAIASFSTHQTYVATNGMAAPGSSVLSTYVTSKGDRSGYGYESGTSMAAPHVAGAAAIIWSTFPSLTREQVRTALRSSVLVTAAASQNPNAYGAGLLNIPGALSLAQIACACTPTPAPNSPTTTRTPSVTPTRTHTPTVTQTPTATTTRTVTLTPTATTTRTVTLTPTATMTVTKSPTATTTVTMTSTATSTATVTVTPTSSPANAVTNSGSGGGGGGGSAAPPAPARSVSSAPPSAVSPSTAPAAPVATESYGATIVRGQSLQIVGADGSLISADVAYVDPESGQRRFRGWLRSDSGPIFGVGAAGYLEWISPDDSNDIADIDWGKVQTIPDSALTSAPMAQPRIGWLLWDFRGSGRIFVVGDDGALHHIPDMETFLARFEWKNVLPVSAGQVRQLPAGAGIATVK